MSIKTKSFVPSKPDPLPDLRILDTLPHPVLLLDQNLDIFFANYAAQVFFCTSIVMLKKHNVKDLLPPASPMLGLIDKARNLKAEFKEYRIDIGTPKVGLRRIVDAFAGCVPGHSEYTIILLQEKTIADDMDAHFHSSSAVRSASSLAELMAHEIKNPLSGIRGAAQLLEATVNDEDKPFARLIREETDRIVKLIERMDFFSENSAFEQKAINIHLVLDHVLRLAESGFACDIDLVENYDPSLPQVYASRDHMIQVFLNLIKNAAEALENKKSARIIVTTSYRPGFRMAVAGHKERIGLPVEVTIADNGAGIPETVQPYLFDPFVSDKKHGKGLGLALVAKIISDHGGVISFDSTSQGTVFRVRLPVKTSEKPGVRNKQEHELGT